MARIVILEPQREVRQALRAMLRDRAGVFAVGTIHEALKAINQANPDVVVVALDLGPGSEMHGLKFAKMVRGATGGDLRKIIVYGVPEGKSPSDAKVEQLQKDYGVDLYVPTNRTPQQLTLKLAEALNLKQTTSSSRSSGRWWHRTSPEVTSFDPDESGDFSIREALESTSVVTAKMNVVGSDDESWGDVLREDVSLTSIKKLLTKDIRRTKD